MDLGEILRGFIHHLQARSEGSPHPLRQAEIARKTGLSQAHVNKIYHAGGVKRATASTCQAFFDHYPDEWMAFLREQPQMLAELQRTYQWLLAPTQTGASAESGDLAVALNYLRTIFRSASARQLVLQQLRVQAEVVTRLEASPEDLREPDVRAPSAAPPASRRAARNI